jgi:vancomycin permeability regulator SanA
MKMTNNMKIPIRKINLILRTSKDYRNKNFNKSYYKLKTLELLWLRIN